MNNISNFTEADALEHAIMNIPKSLGKKQELFARLLPRLFLKAFELGFEIRIGDVFRDPRVHGALGESVGYSGAYSCHKMKLAIDLNLMIGKTFMTNTEEYKELGLWWEDQHLLCCWGGRFDDGCHFSLTHLGIM